MSDIKIEKTEWGYFKATCPDKKNFISSDGEKWFDADGNYSSCLTKLRAAFFKFISPPAEPKTYTGDPRYWGEGVYRLKKHLVFVSKGGYVTHMTDRYLTKWNDELIAMPHIRITNTLSDIFRPDLFEMKGVE